VPVITIHSVMLAALGFLVAAFFGFLLAPLYRRRAARLATDELKRTMPLTTAEIRADKDRLRAEYALTIHRLETKLEDSTHAAAKQMVEINRRDAGISALEGEVSNLRASLEEHENARRVLEQTITDRLPKVEHRLAEAKRLLFQRDHEITTLTQSANRQAQALDEATQINAQQRNEVHRLNAVLAARAARNRETLADPRFDGEVALRSEIEALRTKTREQASLISRLQSGMSGIGAPRRDDHPDAQRPQNGRAPLGGRPSSDPDAEIARLRTALVEAERALKSARGIAEAGTAGQSALEAEMRSLKSAAQDQAAEIARLKAALKTYEAEDADDRAVQDSKIAMKARLSGLSAQNSEQTATIQRLRAEIAAANERLARQAAHFMDEMRRLGAGTLHTTGAQRRDDRKKPEKRSLVDRINAPRPPRELRRETTEGPAASKPRTEDQGRVTGFLRALDKGKADADTNGKDTSPDHPDADKTDASPDETAKTPARRPSLLERITRIEKPAASSG
jgi:chromosome segregation ATPase